MPCSNRRTSRVRRVALLGERQRSEYVDLKVTTNKINRDLGNGTALPNARIVQQHIKIPSASLLHLVGIKKVKLFDSQRRKAQFSSLIAQGGDLRPRLRGGDNVMAVAGKTDGGSFTETGSRASDQDFFEFSHEFSPVARRERQLLTVRSRSPAQPFLPRHQWLRGLFPQRFSTECRQRR
jgi:hypothetical protein